MPSRLRHCVECPRCRTRYVIGFSPYGNGSYLVTLAPYPWEEYVLYCACATPSTASRWRWSEVQTFEISKAAHLRGYGTVEEIVPARLRTFQNWVFDPAKDLSLKSPEAKFQKSDGNCG